MLADHLSAIGHHLPAGALYAKTQNIEKAFKSYCKVQKWELAVNLAK